jgi:hypothetical protein
MLEFIFNEYSDTRIIIENEENKNQQEKKYGVITNYHREIHFFLFLFCFFVATEVATFLIIIYIYEIGIIVGVGLTIAFKFVIITIDVSWDINNT